jgi:hypothetical protein
MIYSLIFFATGRRNSLRKLQQPLMIPERKISKKNLLPNARKKPHMPKKVGQLTMQVDWMKKKSEEVLGPDYESRFSPKPFED